MENDSNSNMNDSRQHVRSVREIKKSLLQRAIKEGRGPEMIKLIQWRLSYIKYLSSEDEEILEELKHLNDGQPRSVQMLNALARHAGVDERFLETEDEKFVTPGPSTLQ